MAGHKNVKKSAILGFIWRFSERMGAQFVTFIVSIVIARLLDPEDFGIIAMVNVFIALADVLVNSGFGNALIQKKNADEVDFSTVFYFQIAFSVVIYIVLFFTAPLISNFYGNEYELLTPILRVLGIRLFLTAINSVQNAVVSRGLLFKKFFFATLGGTILSAVLGIVSAYLGFGAWALVIQYLTNSIVDTIILWITVKWRPKWTFSFTRLKDLLSFGWKLLVSALLDTGYSKLRDLLIGKVYTASDLAYYNRGSSYPNLLVNNINVGIDSVLFPIMSNSQDDIDTVKNMTRRAIKTSCYIITPLMVGLAVVADSLIRIMLTDKWLPAVPYLQIYCFVYAFWPIHTANLNAIKALGRSDIFLKLEIIKKVIGILALLFSIRFGVFWVAFSGIFTTVVSSFINAFPNKKLMNYSYMEQLKDILPGVLLSVFMGGCVYCVNFLHLNNWLTLLIQVPLGVIIYIGLSALFKLESFTYVLDMIKPFINKIFNKKRSFK